MFIELRTLVNFVVQGSGGTGKKDFWDARWW